MVEIPLVGRAAELEVLKESCGDMVVEGQPGVGKTFVLQLLVRGGWGLFAVDDERERVADAVRKLRPPRVIVEDWHFAPEQLSGLLQLRKEIGGDFSVVVTTWPGRRAEVQRILGTSTAVVLEPLPREDILRVVKEVGIAGPTELQRRIVDQALGRPGLAATLSQLCLRGNVTEVATGEALMKDTLSSYRRTIGERSAGVLGLLALSGDSGLGLEIVADALRLDLPTVTAIVRDLGSAGTIDEAWSGRIRVQPEALRYALVRETFFGAPGRLDVRTALEALPDPTSAVRPLVGAAHLGARVDRAVLETLLQGSSDCRAFAWYATLGQGEAERALILASGCKQEIAEAALGSSSAPQLALHTLMGLSVGDNRSRFGDANRSMGTIKEYVLAPLDTMSRRETVRRAVETWLDQGGNPAVALEAMSYALRPGVDFMETDPGRGMTVTIHAGPLPLQDLRQLARLWDPYVELVVSGGIEDFGPALRVLGDWCYPARVSMGRDVPEEWLRFAKRQVVRAVRVLAARLRNRPGFRAALRRLSVQAGLRVRIGEDQEFRALFPVEDLRGWSVAQARWQRSTRRLASRWAELPPSIVAERLVRYEREATMAGITWPRQTPELCSILANDCHEPSRYLDALREQDAPPELLRPFLAVLSQRRLRGWRTWVNEFLDDERLRHVAVDVCLSVPVGERLTQKAVGLCDGRLANWLQYFPKERLNPAARRPLLEHSDVDVAQAAVIALRPATGEDTSDDLGQTWESALIRCPADDTWYPAILERRPDLLVRWVVAWSVRVGLDGIPDERLPKAILPLVGSLDLGVRIHLLQSMTPHRFNPWLDQVIAAAVGKDEVAMRTLLSRHDLRDHHASPLSGLPDEGWFQRAVLLLDAGWSAEQIVASCIPRMSGWMGDESAHWGQFVSAFGSFLNDRDPRRAGLARAGVKYYRGLVATAETRERRDAVYGRR